MSTIGLPATHQDDPPVIAVVSAKGGTGKTTMSMMLGFAAARTTEHSPAIVVDADPYGGAASWQHYAAEPLDDVLVVRAPGIDAAPLQKLRLDRSWKAWKTLAVEQLQEAQTGPFPRPLHVAPTCSGESSPPPAVLLDGAPSSHVITRAAIEAADLVLIPCPTGGLDMAQTAVTWQAAKAARRPAMVVPNLVDVRTRERLEIVDAIEQAGMRCSETMISMRAIYRRAFATDPTDVGEFEALWLEVCEAL